LVYTLQAALPALRTSTFGGRVVFISSGLSAIGMPGFGSYGASKAALNSLSRVLASEEPNIVSVCIKPGQADTDMHSQIRSPDAEQHIGEASRKLFLQLHEEGKLVKAEDTGHVIAT